MTWTTSDPSSSVKPPKAEEPQQVFIGIFPASHIFVRDELSDAEGRLPDLASTLNAASIVNGNGVSGRISPGDVVGPWTRNRALSVDQRQDDEENEHSSFRKPFLLGPPPEQANSSRAGLPVYSTSLRSSSPAEPRVMKPLPPRPSLKSGDDTASGALQPIIDEIASALREWHTLMFQYLARRDYKLFHVVREHIEALHLGRRQLLAQTLNAEETVNMRRDCVLRLVSGNLVQGLDVIVRHPTWGGLVTVDVEGDVDPRSWTSAIRMYTMQASLAYLNVSYDDTRPFILGPSTEYIPAAPLPTPANSAFPDALNTYTKTAPPSQNDGSLVRHGRAKFSHVYFDLRAFVASPCAPGETAELFFSLYKKQGTQFVTEEFCVILNHNGVLARDPTSRIRTLFVDLSPSDIQDPIYLVCRIVRTGALKIGSGLTSGLVLDGRRGSEVSSLAPDAGSSSTVGWNDSIHSVTSNGTRTNQSPDGSSPFRRPFGCAVLELTQLTKMLDNSDISPMKEHNMPIYVPTAETSFSMIHHNIINNNTKEFEKSSR